MKHWFIRSLILSIGLISLKAQGESCVINYPDYTKMDFIKRWYYSVDYRLTHEFMTNSENRAALKAKGYKLNRNPLVLFNDGFGDLALKGVAPSVARVNKEGILKLQVNFKHPDTRKPMQYNYSYASLDEVPKCGGLRDGIKDSVDYRLIYLKAYRAYRDGRYGETMIYLEALAKTMKGLSVDASSAVRRYRQLLIDLSGELGKLVEEATWGEQIDLLRNSLLSAQVNSYTRSQTSIIDALRGDGANCVGNSALFSALVRDLNIDAPDGFKYGIELWIRHKQFVVTDVEKGIVYDVLANDMRGKLVTPIMSIDAHLRDALAKFQKAAWGGDYISLASLNRGDYLYVTPEPEERNEVDIDGFKKGRKENPTRYTEEELRNRIDIFSMDYDRFTLAEYSDEPIPRRASNAHLIGRKIKYREGAEQFRELLENFGLGRAAEEKERSKEDNLSRGEPYWTNMGFDSNMLLDPDAEKAYREALERGRYLPGDIKNYGFHKIAQYFPSNSPLHVWRHMMFPLKVVPVNYLNSGTITFLRNGAIVANAFDGSLEMRVNHDLFEQLKTMPMVERYHYFFNRVRGELSALHGSVIPRLIEVFERRESVEELPRLLEQLQKTALILGSCDKPWITNTLFRKFTCMDFIEFNVPGFKEQALNLFRAEANFSRYILDHPDFILTELDKMDESLLRLILDNFNSSKALYDLVEPGTVAGDEILLQIGFEYLARHMLRNRNYFYTSALEEGEELPKELFSTDGSMNTIPYVPNSFERSVLENSPPLDASVQFSKDALPPRCDHGVASLICVVSPAKRLKEREITREVRLINPVTFTFLASFLDKSKRPDDVAFLALAWRKAHSKNPMNVKLTEYRKAFRTKVLSKLSVDFHIHGSALHGCKTEIDPMDYQRCVMSIVKNRFDQARGKKTSWGNSFSYLQTLVEYALNVESLVADTPRKILNGAVDLDDNSQLSYDFSNVGDALSMFTNEQSRKFDEIKELVGDSSVSKLFQFDSSPSWNIYEDNTYIIANGTSNFYNEGFYKSGHIFMANYGQISASFEHGVVLMPLVPNLDPLTIMEFIIGPNPMLKPRLVEFENTLL